MSPFLINEVNNVDMPIFVQKTFHDNRFAIAQSHTGFSDWRTGPHRQPELHLDLHTR